mgnify:CR=1 FL=1
MCECKYVYSYLCVDIRGCLRKAAELKVLEVVLRLGRGGMSRKVRGAACHKIRRLGNDKIVFIY